jgi:hypothetical protein
VGFIFKRYMNFVLATSFLKFKYVFRMDEEEEIDPDIKEIAEDYAIEPEEAEEVLDLADELGVDYDEAYEIWENQ